MNECQLSVVSCPLRNTTTSDLLATDNGPLPTDTARCARRSILCPKPIKVGRTDLRPRRRGLPGRRAAARVDYAGGERAYIRKQPHGRLFITRDPADTIFFPDRPRPVRRSRGTAGSGGRTGRRLGYLIRCLNDRRDSKRKPNFDDCNSALVVLADGQSWHVPKPWLEIRPVFRRGKAVTAYPVLTCGAELDAGWSRRWPSADDLDTPGRRRSLRWRLIFCWHYDLDRCDLDRLLCVSVGRRGLGELDPRSLRGRDGAIRPKSLTRWRRLTLLRKGPMPPMMLLEDAEDVCDFFRRHGERCRAQQVGSRSDRRPHRLTRWKVCSDAGSTGPDYPAPHRCQQSDWRSQVRRGN